MALTKKQYKAIAEIIAKNQLAYNDENRKGIRAVAYDLSDYFAEENWHFQRLTFLQACGIL